MRSAHHQTAPAFATSYDRAKVAFCDDNNRDPAEEPAYAHRPEVTQSRGWLASLTSKLPSMPLWSTSTSTNANPQPLVAGGTEECHVEVHDHDHEHRHYGDDFTDCNVTQYITPQSEFVVGKASEHYNTSKSATTRPGLWGLIVGGESSYHQSSSYSKAADTIVGTNPYMRKTTARLY